MIAATKTNVFVAVNMMLLIDAYFLQDKERRKLKEKLDNCVKKYLFDFCELLDIPISKESKKVSQ